MTPTVGVVVVGGGVAGVSCAAALRSLGYDDTIVLVDRSAFPYDRPPLSKDYLAGTRDLERLALQPPQWYVDQRIELLAGTDVVAVRPGPDAVEVELGDGRSLRAGHVVLATGGRPARPPLPGIDSPRVHVLREAADADRLRAALGPGTRLLIVGAGLIGAEVASTARGLGCEVTLVDPLDPPLMGAAGEQVAAWLHAQHAAHGIETVAGSVVSLEDCGSGIAVRLTGEDAEREFDAVLLGVGMVPETALAQEAGLEVDRGVLVDEGQRTGHPRVLAIGDTARRRDAPRAEHWEAAQHDGRRAAATIVGAAPEASTASWWWSDRHGHHVEGVGRMAADPGVAVVLRGVPGEGPFAAFAVADGRVVGAVAVDDSHAVRAARRLIDRGTAVEAEQLADPATDLRRLLRG